MGQSVATTCLSQEDTNLIKGKLRKGMKIALFFIIAFIVTGILWALGSGYYEPLFLAVGAIIITLISWYFGRKSNIKELETNQKMIYRGIVRKSQTETGYGNNKITHYGVTIGEEYFDSITLFSSFADNDEVEVHMSAVKRIILKKEILRGTGNLEFKTKVEPLDMPLQSEKPIADQSIKPDVIPKEIASETALSEEEISFINALRTRRIKYFLISLIIVPLSFFIFYRLYIFWDMIIGLEDLIIEGTILIFVFLIVWYYMVGRIVIDLKKNKKKIVQTIIIDKERRNYGNGMFYLLRTTERDIEVSYDGFEFFRNHEDIEVQYTAYTKRLIRIIGLSEKNKEYKSEKFFSMKKDKSL
jgi:hypothetical protein